jgi:predicted peptidase
MKGISFIAATALLLSVLVACRKGNGDTDNKPAVYDSTPSPFMQKTVVELDAYHKQNAWLQVPVHYNSGFDTEKYPLLIFLNGRFEGADYGGLEKMLGLGVPSFMADSLRFTFDVGGQQQMIVLCPQSTNGHTSPLALNQIIDYMLAKYRVDPARIYLTGLSSGAASVFSYLTYHQDYANRIAAAVPMSSIELETEKVANLNFIAVANTPVKIFCGTKDDLYPENKSYADEINKHRPGLAVFTTYNGGHGSWNPMYNPTHKSYNPNMYEWMLQYHK